MDHPGDLVNRHLQITLTPTEYQAILEQQQRVIKYRKRQVGNSFLWEAYTEVDRSRPFLPYEAGEEYWGHLPNYLIARCPLCGATYTGRLDTYTLCFGAHPDMWKSVYDEDHQRIGCPHFVAVQTFINLHGIVPTELEYFPNESEVPYVMPVFLPDDIESYVVMHSLPICRIEGNQFVPRYSLYMLTYYSVAPKILWERRRVEWIERGGIPPDPEDTMSMMHTWRDARETPEAWDLPMWVERDKLLWLDLEQPDLPLKAGPVEAFPYGNIEGIRKSHTYRKGKLKIDPY